MTDNLPEPQRALSPAEVSWKVAQKIANTPFVPTAFRGKPESVYAAVLYGEELGLGPMQSLTQIHVIEGKPSLSPEGMRGLVLKAGHRIDVKVAANDRVVLYGKRSDSGSEATVEWTMKDAQLAGLAGRGAWKTYPRAMLMARATSELCRMLFADIIAGLSYTPEEVLSIEGKEWNEAPVNPPAEAIVSLDPITEAVPAEPSVVAVETSWEDAFPGSTMTTADDIFDAEIVPAEPAPTGNRPAASAKQLNTIRAIARGRGIEGDDLKALCSGIVGYEVSILSALSINDASKVIDHLKAGEK
jgi:hypothetical protein